MKAKRKRHEPGFKARVALEALKGVRTIQQIAKEYQIHPVQVSERKKIMLEGAAEAFGPNRARTAGGVETMRIPPRVQSQGDEVGRRFSERGAVASRVKRGIRSAVKCTPRRPFPAAVAL